MPATRSLMMVGENNSVREEATASNRLLLRQNSDIGLDGETRAGQYALRRDHIIARKTEAVGELQPALDAAVAFAQAVMILDALAPLPAILGIWYFGQDRRILDRESSPDNNSD